MDTIIQPDKLVFGLDIGTRSVVGTVGYKKNAREFVVVAQCTKLHETRAMLDGQIHDIGKVAETISEVRRELERQTGRKLEEVCIAAAGRVLKTVEAKAELEFASETLIDAETIHSLEMLGVEKAYQSIREATKHENMQYFCVAYTVIRYYLNDYTIMNLEDHKAVKISADIIVTFLPEEVIGGLYAAVEKAGLAVANLTLEPIAAMQVAIPENYRLLNLALVDVGAGTSDICITKGGSVTAYGMIPMAGDALTEIIVQNHLVDFQTAEEIKIATTSNTVIHYKDIIGLPQEVAASDVIEEVWDVLTVMAEKIAAQIIALNGDKPVSAVFVVGGGGKIPGFTELLAQNIGIAKERVALRGEEVLGDVCFLQADIKKDPLLVTPIGICLNYYEQKNNFIYVRVNGERIKLYDNSRLTIVDAAVQFGYTNEKLFPSKGKELNFTLNGEKRMIRGSMGEAAEVLLNGKPAGLMTRIAANDDIQISDATVGEPAKCEVGELAEYRATITFIVNGMEISCPKFLTANGELVSQFYSIQENDALELLDYYTLKQVLEFLDIQPAGSVLVNHLPANAAARVYENFSVDINLEEQRVSQKEEVVQEEQMQTVNMHSFVKTEQVKEVEPETERKQEPASVIEESVSTEPITLLVFVNQKPIRLTGKPSYRLVDVLDFYPFDVKEAHGSQVVIQINGEKANFSQKLAQSDQIALYWLP